MPDRPSWFHRVPDILAELEHPTAPPFLDRASVEQLFRVGRRQAIRLLSHAGGYQVGRTYLVKREQLASFLRQTNVSGAVSDAVTRKVRILDELEESRRIAAGRRVSIPVSRKDDPLLASLPPGIELAPGKLYIQFDDPIELLQRLFLLSQALSNDFEGLQRLCDSQTQPSVDTALRSAT